MSFLERLDRVLAVFEKASTGLLRMFVLPLLPGLIVFLGYCTWQM
jgi:hypothetical protein